MYPDPAEEPEGFLDWLIELDQRFEDAVLLPMTDITVPVVLRHKASFHRLRTTLPSLEAYDAVSDKFNLHHLARRAGIKAPRTLRVRCGDCFPRLDELEYPLVIKPARSVTRIGDRSIKRTVSYAQNPLEATARLRSLVDEGDEMLLQQYVQGVGAGVFALYDEGKPIQFFAHRRIREKPPSGGVSVVCESVPLRDDLVGAARAVLDPLSWHGVAMLEFKVDAKGTPWLIEINARLWGSLQLAVDAGADFPAMLYDLAVGDRSLRRRRYRTGCRLRWFLGDLDNLYLTLRERRSYREKLAAVARFCVFWQPGLRYELLRFSDPQPACYALRDYVDQLFASIETSR